MQHTILNRICNESRGARQWLKTTRQRHVVNKTYEEIRIGDCASLSRTLMPEDVRLFAVLSGDGNRRCRIREYTQSGMFREVMAHGMWSGSLISTVLGTQFPGPGTILIDETLHFARPVTIGDTHHHHGAQPRAAAMAVSRWCAPARPKR
jgi:acyl dehydratase